MNIDVIVLRYSKKSEFIFPIAFVQNLLIYKVEATDSGNLERLGEKYIATIMITLDLWNI